MGTLGHCGVDVFFALSGFIIYGLLLKKRIPYWKFVRRRVTRLYPAFIAVFLLYLILSLSFPDRSKIPHSFFPAAIYLALNLLMLPGIFPITPMITVAWSLSYELGFYLTMPLVFRYLKLAAWPKPARIGFFLAVCAVWLTLPAGLAGHRRMVMFGCGILLYETIQIRPAWSRFGNYAAPVMFFATLTLIGVHSQTAVTLYCGPVITHPALQSAFLFASTFALGYSALGDPGWLSKAFSWDWLRWFGNISYSYYLFHGLVLHLLLTALVAAGLPAHLSAAAFVALCAICFAATVAGSVVMFLAVEKRFSFAARAVPSAPAITGANV
jgi:peptidoglycan/LPS O-acetylase OafA/YrhL